MHTLLRSALQLVILGMAQVTGLTAQTRIAPWLEYVFTTPVLDDERRFGGWGAALGCSGLFTVDSSWTWAVSVGAVEKRCDIYRAFFAPSADYARIVLDYAELNISAVWSRPLGPLRLGLHGGFGVATPFAAEAQWYDRRPDDPAAQPVRVTDLLSATATVETACTFGGWLLWPVTEMASVVAGYSRCIGLNETLAAPSEECQGCREGSYRTREDRLRVGLMFEL